MTSTPSDTPLVIRGLINGNSCATSDFENNFKENGLHRARSGSSDSLPRKQKADFLNRLFAKRCCQIVSLTSFVLLAVCIALLLTLVIKLFGDSRDVSSMRYTSSNSFNLSLLPTKNITSFSNGNVTGPSPADDLRPTTSGLPPYTNCGDESTSSVVQAVYSDFCDERSEEGRCRLKVGSEGTLEILFVPKTGVKKPQAGKCGRLLLGAIALTCESDVSKYFDGCKGFNLPCPLEANQLYKYRAVDTTRTLPGLTDLRVNSEISVLDDNGNYVFCVTIPILIVA